MAAKNRFGFLKSSLDFEDLLKDEEIDVIDICTPPYMLFPAGNDMLKTDRNACMSL